MLRPTKCYDTYIGSNEFMAYKQETYFVHLDEEVSRKTDKHRLYKQCIIIFIHLTIIIIFYRKKT